MMKRLWIPGLTGAMLALAGCNAEPNTGSEANGSAAATADTAAAAAIAADTAGTAAVVAADSAAPAASPDSAIQQVASLTLHAVGNTPEEMYFDQSTLQAKAGALVKLKLINDAQAMPMVHNVVFTAPGKYKAVALAGEKIGASGNYVPKSKDVIAASPIALPGQTIELEFTAPKEPGVYEFVCTYPEHWQRMHGKFVVK